MLKIILIDLRSLLLFLPALLGVICESIAPVKYANSPVYLQYLENMENRFYKLLKERELPPGLDLKTLVLVEKYLTEYEENVGNHTKEVSSNSILTLQMLGRIYRYGKMYDVNIFNGIFQNDLIDEDAIPSGSDAEEVAKGILRLQHIYGLEEAHELANGIIHGTPTNTKFSLAVWLELGGYAMTHNYFTLALQWFDAYLHYGKEGIYDKSITPSLTEVTVEETVIQHIRATIKKHNQFLTNTMLETLDTYDDYSFTTPVHSISYSANAHLAQRDNILKKFVGKVIMNESDNDYDPSLQANMLALCNGESIQSENVKSRLNCFLDRSRHPYWAINPLKTEVHSETPRIVQFYDIIGDVTTETLKNLAYSELDEMPQYNRAALRTAAYAWLQDDQIWNLPLVKNIELITGLSVVAGETADDLQVAAYAPGGFVSPHYDSFSQGASKGCVGYDDEDDDDDWGHRVNTFLVYLNKVEKGGRTVFPFLGVAIHPVKHSAVMWFTNLKNGQNDNRMMHVACPVIKGHKWIATKWTRINGNELRYPCGLTPNE